MDGSEDSPGPVTLTVPAEGPIDATSLAPAGAPIELEVGFGKGRFLLAAAALWPDHSFVGLEHAGSLVRKVAGRVERAGLRNVRLVRIEAWDFLSRLEPAACLRRVHVYCPDPWPKRKHAKNRLFSPDFITDLARVLEPGGSLLLKTDHDPYVREVRARLAGDERFAGCTPEEAFAGIPPGGFDAIFEEAGTPVFRRAWERAR